MYEYKAVPAPVRAPRVKGLKTSADRFAHMLSAAINAEAHGGWQFLRSETLTCEERSALGRVRTSTQTVLIFARALSSAAEMDEANYGYASAADPAPQAMAGHEEAAYGGRYADARAPQAEPYAQAPHAQDAYDQAEYSQTEPEQPGYAPADYDQAEYEAEPAQAPSRPVAQRQEPLFRSSALLRGGEASRVEPVLRPRTDDTDRDRS